ncbi:hypothetical protein NDN08_004043 [Rhodosorus marinus]|uniref:Pentatricopeptide repeat-containing protein n=1 Tax=Rhodosorus marinus TaxID=101924 RepID=A0AAV8UL51_9RHOD|nr:hypothetical protein NDN08_004043 [Rhodosorus marinus]
MSWSHKVRVKLDRILRNAVREALVASTQEKSTANRMYRIVRVAMDDLRIRDPRLVNRSSEDIRKLVRVTASMGILDLTDRPLNPNIVEGAVLDIGESYSWLCAYRFMKLTYTHLYLKPTPGSCSILLRNLCKMDRGEELQELVRIMIEEEIPLGKDLPGVFADCLSFSGENGFGLGLLIFQLLLDRSQLDILTCDVVFTALVRGGELDKALEVLQTMEKSGLRFREPGKTVEDFWGWIVFTDRRVLPDMHVPEGEEHVEGLTPKQVILRKLGYKAWLGDKTLLSSAAFAMIGTGKQDVHYYNCILAIQLKLGQENDTFAILRRMRTEQVKPNGFTMVLKDAVDSLKFMPLEEKLETQKKELQLARTEKRIIVSELNEMYSAETESSPVSDLLSSSSANDHPLDRERTSEQQQQEVAFVKLEAQEARVSQYIMRMYERVIA